MALLKILSAFLNFPNEQILLRRAERFSSFSSEDFFFSTLKNTSEKAPHSTSPSTYVSRAREALTYVDSSHLHVLDADGADRVV